MQFKGSMKSISMLKHCIGKSLDTQEYAKFSVCDGSVAKRNGNNNTWAKYVLRKRGHLNGFCLSLQMTGVLDFTSRERTETQCR